MIEFIQQSYDVFLAKMSLSTILQVGRALESNTSEVRSVVKTVLSWASMIMGAVGFIQCILIFTSGGQGEDKLRKAGTWLFMVVFCAIALVLLNTLFK